MLDNTVPGIGKSLDPRGSSTARFKTPKNLSGNKATNPNQPQDITSYFHRTHDYIKTNKREINKWFHAGSALVNGLSFLNGNFRFVDIESELQEKIGNFFARCTTAVRGITGAVDCLDKNNLIPCIGNVLEVPTSAFASGFLLWLARGIPQSIRQIQGVIKRSGMKVKNNEGKEIILNEKDGDNFKKYGIGIKDGFFYSIKELGKILRDTFTDPFKKEQFFSRSVLFCSLFQFIGPIISFFGLNKLGALSRDFGGALVDGAYILDPRKDKNEPSYIPAGTLWIGSAICDYTKLFSFFSDRINNLTQLSLGFDALAAIFESRANFGGDGSGHPQAH